MQCLFRLRRSAWGHLQSDRGRATSDSLQPVVTATVQLIPILVIAIICMGAGLLGTIVLERNARRLNLVQAPNERSSHTIPTARGGGAVIALVSVLCAFVLGLLGSPEALVMAALVGIIAALGFADDMRDLSPGIRFAVQAATIICLLWVTRPLPDLLLGFDLVIAGLPLAILVMLAGLWWVNLFNFMDGIDGNAASQAILLLVVGASLTLQAGLAGEMDPIFWISVCTAAATGGFLIRNWPPARIFMGDVGSNALAIVILMLALATIAAEVASYQTWLILISVFATDATVTLLRRLARGNRPWQAHRSHAYQQLARQLGHRATTTIYAGLTIAWAMPLATLSLHASAWQWWLVILTYVPLVGLVLWAGGGAALERTRAGQFSPVAPKDFPR